jgi:hypothetical protein
MTENVRQVLDMLAAGQITPDEADRLITALRGPSPSTVAAAAPDRPAAGPRYLRVMVDAVDPGEGPVKVNVRVPFLLLRAGVRLASLIPANAQNEVNAALRKQGLDIDITKIKPENLDEVIDAMRDLTVDVGNERGDLKVRIFTE